MSKPSHIKDVIKKYIKPRLRQQSKKIKLSQLWYNVVGDDIAGHTKVKFIKGNILYIDVDNPGLLQELSTFYKESLINSLKNEGAPITDIRFKVGKDGR